MALADLVGVTPQAIHNYETTKSIPSPRVTEGLASALKMPIHFFLLPRRPDHPMTYHFRSMSAATKAARVRAQRRADWLCDLFDRLCEYVEFPSINLPDSGLPSNPAMIRDEEIEEIADSVRDYWQMRRDPIANMVTLLENQGVVVSRGPFGDATLDGLSVIGRRPTVMIGTDKGTTARWRFDAAHELGHMVLHSEVDARTAMTTVEHKRLEDQANRFAGAFLLPMSSFGEDFFAASLDALRSIKPKWRVSIGMMIFRARHAGLLNEQAERRLWVNYARRGWRRLEPYDDRWEPELPSLVRNAVNLVVEHGRRDDLLHSVALPDSDVELLAGLPPGSLSAEQPPTVRLRPRARESGSTRDATIHQFRRP